MAAIAQAEGIPVLATAFGLPLIGIPLIDRHLRDADVSERR